MHACENVQFCSRARRLVNWKGAVELWVKCVMRKFAVCVRLYVHIHVTQFTAAPAKRGVW